MFSIHHDPELFAKSDWKSLDREDLRAWTLEELDRYVDRFSWNKDGDVVCSP